MKMYLQSCKTDFWKNIFEAELAYTLRELKGTKDVLSVGCGPAIIETGLAEHGFDVTGLDVSKEALEKAPDSVRTVVGSAEDMAFAEASFDAAICVASLQFIESYQEAVRQIARVLRPSGRLLAMLLNPKSDFFKDKAKNPASYVNRIKHTDLNEIEKAIAEYFFIQTEFFLGIRAQAIFESRNPGLAGLYVIKGKKKSSILRQRQN